MNKKMILVGIEANMLEILNNELVEYGPGDVKYEMAMDALERLISMVMVLDVMDDSEVADSSNLNVFNDREKIEKALHDISRKMRSEDTPGADRDGDDLDFDDYRKELKEETERIFIADGWIPRRSSIGSLHMVIDGLAYSYESYLETIGPIDDLEGIWVDF